MLRGDDPFPPAHQDGQARAAAGLDSVSLVSCAYEDRHREPVGKLRKDIKFLRGRVAWLGRGIVHHPIIIVPPSQIVGRRLVDTDRGSAAWASGSQRSVSPLHVDRVRVRTPVYPASVG